MRTGHYHPKPSRKKSQAERGSCFLERHVATYSSRKDRDNVSPTTPTIYLPTLPLQRHDERMIRMAQCAAIPSYLGMGTREISTPDGKFEGVSAVRCLSAHLPVVLDSHWMLSKGAEYCFWCYGPVVVLIRS